MRNNLSTNTDALRAEMMQALKENDADAFSAAFDKRMEQIGEDIKAEYRESIEAEETSRALASRGVRQLTPEEKKFYQKFAEAVKAADPKQAIANIGAALPETVINTVFDELRTNHPLLSKLNFRPTGGAIKWLASTDGYEKATWGKLCDEIVKEITAGFKEVDSTLYKLSAFLPVCKAMIELGPDWLDRYVREVLYEALANGLEYGYIMGDGNDAPIGMVRAVGADVSVVNGAYPKKEAVELTDFSPTAIGALLGIMAVNENGKSRNIRDVVLLVNPADYFTKVMPATTLMAPDGTYRRDVLPYPMAIIQSPAVDLGEAILGFAPGYIATAGIQKEGRIEYSDHVHFLEDERVYLIKTFANGFPVDNNAFLRLDISNLQPLAYQFVNVTPPEPSDDATLSSLSLGSATLSPTFDPDEDTYTASTTNATNTITAVPANAHATIVITLTNTTHSTGLVVNNGSAITWDTGENTVEVEVTAQDGTTTETYTVTVTKS